MTRGGLATSDADYAALRPDEANFGNASKHVQSWYVVAPSAEVRAGQASSFEMLGRTIVAYRGASGRAYVAEGYCPHLGAALSLGTVHGEVLRCAFHGWCFAANEKERLSQSDRRWESVAPQLRYYPAIERYGLLWMFNGERPLFDLPTVESNVGPALLPAQRLRCHPHIVLANGFDTEHFGTLHGFDFTSQPKVIRATRFEIAVELNGRPRSVFLQSLLGLRQRSIEATLSTIGGSLALVSIRQPFPLTVLFTGKCSPDGECLTKTVVFFPSRTPLGLLKSCILLGTILHNDRRVLNTIRFTPNFVASDRFLKLYYDTVNQMPCG